MGSYIKDALDQYFWSITFQILQSFTCEVEKKKPIVYYQSMYPTI